MRTVDKGLSALSISCTRHGDELSITNSGNEPWKRLCSNMGPALDDDDSPEVLFQDLRRDEICG